MRTDYANQFNRPHARQARELPSDDKPMPNKPTPRNFRAHIPPPPHRDWRNLAAVAVALATLAAVLFAAFH